MIIKLLIRHIISLSFSYFSVVLSRSFTWGIFLCLPILFCFLCLFLSEGGKTAISFKLDGTVLCIVNPHVDCACPVTLAGWLGLCLVWAGVLGLSILGHPGEMARSEVGVAWGGPRVL